MSKSGNNQKSKTEKQTIEDMIEESATFVTNQTNRKFPMNDKEAKEFKQEVKKILKEIPEDDVNKKRDFVDTVVQDISNVLNAEGIESKEVLNKFRERIETIKGFNTELPKDKSKAEFIEGIVETVIKKRKEDIGELFTDEHEKEMREKLTETLNKLPDKLFFESSLEDKIEFSTAIQNKMRVVVPDYGKIVKEFGDKTSTKQKIKDRVNQMKKGLQKVPEKISKAASNSASRISKTFSNLRKKSDKSIGR